MKLGAVFPQTEIESDPVIVRDLAQAVEESGFDHLLAYDHVLGASHDCDPKDSGRWVSEVRAWKEAGGTHLSLVTMNLGLPDPQAHIDTFAHFKRVIDESGILA